MDSQINSDSLNLLNDNLVHTLNTIERFANGIVLNTQPNSILDWSSIVASVATVVGILFLFKEFSQNKINKECQLEVFNDIIRHFYRNKIIIMAMMLKYRSAIQSNPNKHSYPSHEHYRKLVVLSDDLHLERYYSNSRAFKKLHELHLLLRNFNIESEVALDHMKNKCIPLETKLRDFDGLNLKCATIIMRITELVDDLWKHVDSRNNTWQIIVEDSKNSIHNRDVASNITPELLAMITNRVKQESTQDILFTKIIDKSNVECLEEMLIGSLAAECSSVQSDFILPEKIHIIVEN